MHACARNDVITVAYHVSAGKVSPVVESVFRLFSASLEDEALFANLAQFRLFLVYSRVYPCKKVSVIYPLTKSHFT